MLTDLDQAGAIDISNVMWGFAKLNIPQAPGKVFLDAVSDNLLWTIDQYGCQVREGYLPLRLEYVMHVHYCSGIVAKGMALT